MIKLHRPLTLILVSFGLSAAVAAQDAPVWLQLDRARTAYSRGEYGDALRLTETARAAKHEITARRIAVLEAAFAPGEVKRAGDDLSAIRPILAERGEKEALDTLDALARTRGAAESGKSASKLIAWLKRSDVFPEADFLEGLVHDAEGETAIALKLYLTAWENRDFLDIPDQRYDILYRMAESSLGLGDADTAEKDYLQILSDDPVYGTPDRPSPTLVAMKNTLVESKDTAKFIRLYRHENRTAFRAAARLSVLYLDDNANPERALNLTVLTATMAVSSLDRVLKTRRLQWDGSTLESLARAFSGNRELSAWSASEGLWDPFLSLSRTLVAAGNRPQALSLLSDLALHCPDPAVARKATGLINSLSLRD